MSEVYLSRLKFPSIRDGHLLYFQGDTKKETWWRCVRAAYTLMVRSRSKACRCLALGVVVL